MARYAAVDIGSNSVRMQAAEVVPGSPIRILASDREVTRLGASVFKTSRISDESIDLVCTVLRRMAEAYAKQDVIGIRAVATAAVRDASNQGDFVVRASEALRAPVEIISGLEEARLIHLGVQSRWPQPNERLLIVDVGGGSAEFIVAEGGEMREGISRPLGAVRLTEVFLKTDPPTPLELHRLEKFIDEKFELAFKRLQSLKFDRVIATSATAAAIVSAINHVPREERENADRLRAKTSQIRKLYKDLSSRGLAERKKLHGIGPRRAEIIIAGAAVFARTLEALNQSAMHYSVAGVRDGIIADLTARGVGRELSRISRQQLRVVEAMCRKYCVDLKNAKHVARLSGQIFHGLEPLHRLPPELGKLLETAAFLHDTGHFISDTGHHKHSAYLVMNSDLPGYTDLEREIVALLCRFHRKSMPHQRHEPVRTLSAESRRALLQLTPLLRIAVALDSTKEQKVQAVDCQVVNGDATLVLRGEGDLDLEIWAAERAADSFREVYNTALTVSKAQS
jgi:exopolyphosphatase / guanosine-5'-triphosphate,3'-diphosphate pyrophosphatase